MSEKTEQPTDQRLRKAREDGNVAKSRDFTQILLMGALFAYTLAMWGPIFTRFGEMIRMPGQLYGMEFREAVAMVAVAVTRAGVEMLLPYLVIVVLVAVLGETLQTGVLFSFKALMPKGDKLDPVKNLQQMFSMKNGVEFIKTSLKVLALTVLVSVVIRDSIGPLTQVPHAGLGGAGLALGEMMKKLVIWTFVAFGAIALADLVLQRYQYIKGLMMSVEEIKQEYKQMEGDPHMKGHRKELAREIAMGEMVENTREASALVTNPTHVAVAIRYVEGSTPLPVVLGKGEGAIAQAMRRVAEEAGVPILRNVPLARGLLARAEIGQYIPSEFIEPVAEVLLTLRRLALEREQAVQTGDLDDFEEFDDE